MSHQLTIREAAEAVREAGVPIMQALDEGRAASEEDILVFRRKLGLLRLALYFESEEETA